MTEHACGLADLDKSPKKTDHSASREPFLTKAT